MSVERAHLRRHVPCFTPLLLMRAKGSAVGREAHMGSAHAWRFQTVLKTTEGILGHVASVVVGLILMVVGLAMGVTMVLLPVGLVIGLLGVALFVGGLFARIGEKI